MRLSVILSELVGTGAAVSLLELSGLFVNTKKDMEQTITKPMFLMILTMSPTLFIVDHIHFQYNGLLLSMLMISLTLIEIGRPMIGLAVFCILLFMKHLYVYGKCYIVRTLPHFRRRHLQTNINHITYNLLCLLFVYNSCSSARCIFTCKVLYQ